MSITDFDIAFNIDEPKETGRYLIYINSHVPGLLTQLHATWFKGQWYCDGEAFEETVCGHVGPLPGVSADNFAYWVMDAKRREQPQAQEPLLLEVGVARCDSPFPGEIYNKLTMHVEDKAHVTTNWLREQLEELGYDKNWKVIGWRYI